MLTITQRERLIDLVKEARGWDAQGIREALIRVEDEHHPARFATWLRVVGAYVDAEDDRGQPRYKTPALLAEPGPHWDRTPVASRPAPSMCPEHPAQRVGRCTDCADAAAPPPAGWRDALPRSEHRAPARTNPVDAARSTPEQHEAALARCQGEPDPQETQP